MLSLNRGIYFLLWLRRRNIPGFWVNPMTLGLSDCLLRGILRLGGGLLPFALTFTLLSLSILTLDGDLAKDPSNLGYGDGVKNNCRLLRSFKDIGRDLPNLWRVKDVLGQPHCRIYRDTRNIKSLSL